MILIQWFLTAYCWHSFILKSFCSLVKSVTLGIASAVAFFPLVVTIFYAFDLANGCCYLNLRLEVTTVILLPSNLSSISATQRIQLRSFNAIIKVNTITPWMFSAKSNTPLRRKTHTPDSHRWSRLPWLWLLRRQPWYYFQVTYQVSQLHNGFSYIRSML